MQPQKRLIKIFKQHHDFKIDEIAIHHEQFLALKTQLTIPLQDEYVLQVYPLSLAQCLNANIDIPPQYHSPEYEFYLHAYMINADANVYVYGHQT